MCAVRTVSCPAGAARVCVWVCTRVHKQTCCYRPSPPLSLSRIGADFYRRGDSRGKFIKPPLLLLPYLPWAHKQRALSRELRGGGGKVVPFPDQNCPSILSRNASPPLPFSSYFWSRKNSYPTRGRRKDCENRVWITRQRCSVCIIKNSADGWMDGKRYDPHKFLRSVDWKSLNRRG